MPLRHAEAHQRVIAASGVIPWGDLDVHINIRDPSGYK